MTSFTLLLPVYAGNSPEQFREAFESSVGRQTRRPDAVVITIDGPLPASLEDTVVTAAAESPVVTRLVRLGQNRGLAAALNAGLAEIDTEYVARMDADDVCTPRRFELQLAAIEAADLDILGTGLAEFEGASERVVATRIPPVGDQIRRRAPFAQPFNHPTVVYRRSVVLAAGGYPTDVGRLEDYVLFARMLVAGARADNLPEPLLRYRVDDGAYARRGGWAQFRSELLLQRELRRVGLTSRGQHLRNVVLRGSYRLAPTWLRRGGYRAAVTGWRRRAGGVPPYAGQP
ncbi:glycosyltransferase [Pseudolysinimonas sp.]|uniref:glycosyltransferase n=1 Tax=Pseudolysinimonas sp. TaxID=2680009 RepID=UPI003F817C17